MEILKATMFVAVVAALSSCAVAPLKIAKSNGEAVVGAKPSYTVGMSRTVATVWSKERTHTVIDINGDFVSWVDDKGYKWTENIDFTMPIAEWESVNGEAGSHTIVSSEGSVFPMQVGQTAQYVYEGMSNRTSTPWRRTSNCRVLSYSNVQVPASRADVYVVSCDSDTRIRTIYYEPRSGRILAMQEAHKHDRKLNNGWRLKDISDE